MVELGRLMELVEMVEMMEMYLKKKCTKTQKADFEKDFNCMIDFVKVQPHLFVFNSATIRAFFALFGPFGAKFGSGSNTSFTFFGTYRYR